MNYNEKLIVSFVKELLKEKDEHILNIEHFNKLSITNYEKLEAYLDIDFNFDIPQYLSNKTTDIIGLKKDIDNIEVIYELVISKGRVKHLNIWSINRKKLPHEKIFLVDE